MKIDLWTGDSVFSDKFIGLERYELLSLVSNSYHENPSRKSSPYNVIPKHLPFLVVCSHYATSHEHAKV